MKKNKEEGMVLVVSLVLLLVLSIIGVSSISQSNIQEIMARNSKDHHVAFQSAESGLRDAEKIISQLNSVVIFNGTNGYYGETDGNPDYKDQNSWLSGNTIEALTNLNYVSKKAIFFIKLVKIDSSEAIFKITSRGFGITPESEVFLEAYYKKII